MVLGCQPVANVVQKRADDPVEIGPVAFRSGRGLQPVIQPGDLVALKRHLPLAAKLIQNTVGR
jgi:hypothetical protein